MTPNLHKNDESTLVLNRNVRRSFIGLLMALGCFLGFFQPALAGEKPTAANPTITIVKDFSVAGSGNPDIFQLTFNPAPPDGTQLQVNFGSGASLVYFVYGGVVTIPVLNPTVGTVPVTVKSQDGSIVYASVTLTFIAAPGPPDPSQSYIIAVQPSSPADGNSQDIVRAVLYDQYGNPCASGTQVNWLIQSGTATMSPSNGQTTSTGNIATTTYTSLVPGTVNVQAQIFFAGAWRFLPDLTHTNYYVPIQFTVLQPDVTKSYITGITTTTAADGTSQDEVDAVVKDNLGNNVPDGTVVTFSIKSGTATMTVSGTTVNGVVKATFTSTTVGSVDVQAQVDINGVPTYLNDNITGNNYTTIFFTDPPPDITKSSIYGVVTTTAADGTSQNEVDALVKNSLGGNVPDGTVVTFTIKSGTATIVLQTTVQNGIAKAYFTSTVVGSVDVQGQVQINGVWTYLNDRDAPANNYTTVKFTQPPPSLNSSYIVGITTTTLADGTSQNEVDAFVFSAAGPMPVGTPVTFTIKSGTATIVLQTTVQAGGIAKAYFTSTVVGAVDVQAQVDISGVPTFLNDLNAPANNYTTIHFVAGPPVPGDPGGGGTGGTPPGNGGNPPSGGSGGNGNNNGPGDNNNFTVLFVRQDYRLADGTQMDSVIAFVTDAYHHPLKGVTIQFLIQSGPTAGTATAGAKFTSDPTAVPTDDSGMARIALTSTKPGTVFVNAILIIQGVLVDGSYQIVTFTNKPDVNNPLTNLSVVIYEALADGVQQTQVKAHIVDLDGNIMAGQEVVFMLDSGDAKIVTPAPVYTDANGDAYIYITSTKPGFALITATVGGEKIIFGSPARVKFAPINIYVPKVFTPNNDGTNDLLKPILVGIAEFHYWSIYNRWGNLIYTSQDPNRGWDGTFKGVAQPVETYVWIAEGVDVNGKKIVQKGMTSLVR